MLQETFAKNIPPPKLPEYIVFHKPRKINASTVDRGLTTGLRDDLFHVFTSKYTANKDWETLTITVQVITNITLDAINISVFLRQLLDLDLATASTDNFLVAGDLISNLDVYGSSNTIRDRHLLDQLNRSNNIVINDPSVQYTIYGCILDLVVVSPHIFTATH